MVLRYGNGSWNGLWNNGWFYLLLEGLFDMRTGSLEGNAIVVQPL